MGVPVVSESVLGEIVIRYGVNPGLLDDSVIRFRLSHCPAVARPASGEGDSIPIQLVDLSRAGIGFRTKSPLAAGTALVVYFNAPEIPPQAWACRVRWTKRDDGEYFRQGAEFEPFATASPVETRP
jgi:hypothetical protein